MRLSRLLGNRYKERPAEATLDSHALLLRGGYIRALAHGGYALLTPGLRVAANLERLINSELVQLGGQEIRLPLIQPAESRSNGAGNLPDGLCVSFADRAGRECVVAAEYDACAAALAGKELQSYTQLPIIMYQTQTRFRDEPRVRGGLMRAREFLCHDVFSFHATMADAAFHRETYRSVFMRIFARAGLSDVVALESEPGAGSFHARSPAGEDTLVICPACGAQSELDTARGCFTAWPEPPRPLEKVHTPGTKTIDEVAAYLGIEPRQTAKAVFYESDAEGRLVMAIVRGDLTVNERKVRRLIGTVPVPAGDARITSVGAVPGFASPISVNRRQCRILVDRTVAESGNLVCGANEADHHCRNFNLSRDLPDADVVDIVQVEPGAVCSCGGPLRFESGIRLGRIRTMDAVCWKHAPVTYTDGDGKTGVPIMVSCAIGIGRLIAALVEARHDNHGPNWPVAVAPWPVHINTIKIRREPVRETAERLYEAFRQARLEALWDDRDVSAGVQFADADLLGAPIRLIVSERNLASGELEYQRRDTGESGRLQIDEAVANVTRWVAADPAE